MSPSRQPAPRTRRPKVLFFSRGRGRGHAVPTLLMAEELRRVLPGVRITFASYGTGARTLRETGQPVIDLEIPEECTLVQSMVAANTVVAREGPDVVISHEEFGALPVAKSLGFPVCFVVDFFTAENTARMETLQYADAIVFIERRGLFPEPSYLRGKVRYVGPVVRAFSATRADRGRVRSTLRVPETARLLSVIPGAWANEKRAPLFDLVTEAFRLIPGTDNCLIWIAGNDSEALATRAPDVTVLRSFAPIEELMVASDLVITKANRGTTIDAASLGVPSVSLSYGLNPIDETIIPRIRTNHPLDARSVDARFLAEVLERRLAETASAAAHPCPEFQPGGSARAAAELARFVREHAG